MCAVASNEVLCLLEPQFPQLCRSRLSRRVRPALTQRDSFWQEPGLPALLRRHRAAGWGTATRLPVLYPLLRAAGAGRGARRGAGKWVSDPRLPRAPRGPAPAASGPAAAGGSSSALRLPPASLPPPSSLARSLAPSPRAGSALTPPHAAAAAGRWRGTTAARCWTKSSPPSSSTISLTRRYGRPGLRAQGQGC